MEMGSSVTIQTLPHLCYTSDKISHSSLDKKTVFSSVTLYYDRRISIYQWALILRTTEKQNYVVSCNMVHFRLPDLILVYREESITHHYLVLLINVLFLLASWFINLRYCLCIWMAHFRSQSSLAYGKWKNKSLPDCTSCKAEKAQNSDFPSTDMGKI